MARNMVLLIKHLDQVILDKESMGKFLSNLVSELASNGKMLVSYGLLESPLTSFPGITTAFHTAATDHTSASYLDLAAQVLLAGATVLRAGKIVKNAASPISNG